MIVKVSLLVPALSILTSFSLLAYIFSAWILPILLASGFQAQSYVQTILVCIIILFQFDKAAENLRKLSEGSHVIE